MKKQLLLAATIFCFLNLINAQPGQLDPSFGNQGIVKTDFGKNYNYRDSGIKVLTQSDGSVYLILLLRYENLTLITKRHSNGSIDSTYGVNGFSAHVTMVPNTAILQADGKILVGGSYTKGYTEYAALARFNTNGSLDNGFSDDGIISNIRPDAYSKIHTLFIQNNKKIVIGIGNTFARYNYNGNPDSTFNGNGIQTNDFFIRGGAIQSDGKIVVVGDDVYQDSAIYYVARYNTDGSLDKTFGDSGKQVTNLKFAYAYLRSVAIQSDGKILVGGTLLVRFNTDGRLDSSFSGDGIVTDNFYGNDPYLTGYSIIVQDDGRIVITVGTDIFNPDFIIIRYNRDGSIDKTFSKDGIQANDFLIASAAIQKDGKIIVGGSDNNNFALARFTANGTPDNTFDEDGKLTDNFSSGSTFYRSTAIQNDGKIIVAGSTGIARYKTEGSLDSSFSVDSTLENSSVVSIALQSDGKIVALGYSYLWRYNTDGSLDTTLSHWGYPYAFYPRSVTIQNDGKIMVCGVESLPMFKYSAIMVSHPSLIRYNTDGSQDQTFGGGQQTFHSIYGIASSTVIQDDGKIVVSGVLTPSGVGEWGFPMLMRLNTDGSIDSTFSNDGISNFAPDDWSTSCTVIMQKDGKIVSAGQSNELQSYDPNSLFLFRFNIDGSPDSSFNRKTYIHHEFFYNNNNSTLIALQNDGKIVVSGVDLLRFNTNGSLDSTFNINARQKVDFDINDIAIADNKLYAVGGGFYGSIARYLLDNDSSQTPPAVSLTTPANNATYLAPAAHIKLTAAASDSDGTVSKVEFYNGTTLLHTETVAPYGFVLRNVSSGNYTITAKATDNSGLVTTSAPVHISVVPNKAPTVNIINPANGKIYPGPATIYLEAAAKDPDGRITQVEFYNGSTLLRTELKLPYRYAWKNVPVGNYSITAKATDNWGAVTTSAVVNVSVVPNKAPRVSITNPANGESITAPATIPLTAFAEDPDGRIIKVDFYNGTTLLRTERKLPYTYHWENAPAGTYTITAVATDNYGLKTTSAPVTVTVLSNTMIVSSKPSSANNKTGKSDALGLNIYPNPATNIVNIYAKGLQLNKAVTLSVISSSGIMMKTARSNSSTQTMQLDVSSLKQGVYTIKVMSGNKVMYKQFVKL